MGDKRGINRDKYIIHLVGNKRGINHEVAPTSSRPLYILVVHIITCYNEVGVGGEIGVGIAMWIVGEKGEGQTDQE